MTGPRLSLCMIVKNEAYFLDTCLSAASDYVDEIVVVDTGSTDSTRDIASRYADKVPSYEWQDHFADARNYSLGQATGDWIIVLDADEVVEPGHWRKIRELIAQTDKDAFFFEQRNYSLEPANTGWVPIPEKTPYTRKYRGYKPNVIARLFRNNGQIRYSGRVHEVIDRSLKEGVNENRESIAVARYCKGDFEGAFDDYMALYESGHRSVDLCSNLANLAVKCEQFSFAADALEEALALGIVNPDVRMRLEHNIRHLREKS